jgi:site-specific DNA-methyltransferase (adenine-specific)
MTYQILKGNSLDLLPTLADNSIDAIVTDPPYELGFMGKTWDNSGIAYSLKLWQQCLRVLKPGGHLLAFSGSRTYHRMVVSIEDAGFEIRDMISWISNKTFPKSLNIGKAIDKAAGAERKVLRWESRPFKINNGPSDSEYNQIHSNTMDSDGYGTTPITEPATDEAKNWDGWGTGLKPTVEPIVMARKPVEGTVANNVLTYGTGGLNIDASRIGMTSEDETKSSNNWKPQGYESKENIYNIGNKVITSEQNTKGRWPANLILDEYTAELLDEQSGQVGNGWKKNYGTDDYAGKQYSGGSFGGGGYSGTNTYADSGGASRFFYVAKASKRDRNEGLEHLPLEQVAFGGHGNNEPDGMTQQLVHAPRQNFHPTVKPTALMQYLVKLVTPPGGTVLDPFTGSGSTGKAAILEGFDFIGIELTEDYWPIIEGRLKHAEAKVAERIKKTSDQEQEKLF